MRPSRLPAFLSATLLVAGCGNAAPEDSAAEVRTSPAPTVQAPATADAERAENRELATAFTQAAAEFQVPEQLLIAIAQAETSLYFVPGIDGDAFEGQPAYGVMALRGERLARGAQLAGVTITQVQTSVLHNVRAAAALLHAEAGNSVKTLDDNDLGAWSAVVARFSGLPTAEAQASYLDTGVYRVLRAGLPEEIARLHGLRLPAHPELPATIGGTTSGSAPWQSVIYTGSVWRPSPTGNFTVGRGGTDVSLLVIHTCAGAYAGCWSWLNTPAPTNPNKTSAHYVVSENGAEVSALVDEVNTAHHVGKPWMGSSTNIRSVGIEHGGFSYQGTNVWSAGQINTSIKLSCDIVKRQAIIQDRNHIIGHYQPDPVNRATDPGTNFPWTDYMARIAACTGGTTPSSDIIVDSNQTNNDSKGKITPPSADWKSSTNVTGY